MAASAPQLQTITLSISLLFGRVVASRALNVILRSPTRTSCTPPSFSSGSLSVCSSFSPSLLHFLTLSLLLVLLFSCLWMPSSRTGWTLEGKEERVGWRTSGKNGRALFFCKQPHGWVWPCEHVTTYIWFNYLMPSPCIVKLKRASSWRRPDADCLHISCFFIF